MESRVVQIPGLAIHYLVAGEGGSELPFVLVHGFPQTSRAWRHQVQALGAEGHPVYALDTRGFGRTGKPRIRVSRAMLAHDVIAFCDAVGVSRAVIVGHDWGGLIAFKAAIDRPDRFTHLALLDSPCTVMSPLIPHPYWYKVAPLPEAFFADRAQAFVEARLGGRDPAVLGGRPANPYAVAGSGGPLPSWMDDETLEHYVESFDSDSQFAAIQYYRCAMPLHRVLPDETTLGGERYQLLSEADIAAMWLHPDGFEAHPWQGEFHDFAPEDRFARFGGPATVIYSQQFWRCFPTHGDQIAPSGNPFADQFARYLPHLRVRSARCGHYIPEELPDLVTDELGLLARRRI